MEPEEQAVDDWVNLILSNKQAGTMGGPECTPGYFNNEGQGWSQAFRSSMGHPGGAKGFFQHIRAWRDSGEFAGLKFTH